MSTGFSAKLARASPLAAMTPRIIASAVADSPMIRLFLVASVQALPCARLSYQRVEKPGSGKTRRLPEVNDIGTMMRIGARRKIERAEAHRARQIIPEAIFGRCECVRVPWCYPMTWRSFTSLPKTRSRRSVATRSRSANAAAMPQFTTSLT